MTQHISLDHNLEIKLGSENVANVRYLKHVEVDDFALFPFCWNIRTCISSTEEWNNEMEIFDISYWTLSIYTYAEKDN